MAGIAIPLWANLMAIAVGGVQGALFAAGFRDRRLDLLGVAIIGLATGLGGGILRDLLLGLTPSAFLSDWYIPVAVGAALVGMLLQTLLTRAALLIALLDALTLGLFGAIGTSTALSLGLPAIPAIFIGSISAVGGSVLRDLLLNMPIALMHVGSLYAVAAVSGAVVLVVLTEVDVPLAVAAAVCVGLTFLIRVLAVRYGWSLPEQRALRRLHRTASIRTRR